MSQSAGRGAPQQVSRCRQAASRAARCYCLQHCETCDPLCNVTPQTQLLRVLAVRGLSNDWSGRSGYSSVDTTCDYVSIPETSVTHVLDCRHPGGGHRPQVTKNRNSPFKKIPGLGRRHFYVGPRRVHLLQPFAPFSSSSNPYTMLKLHKRQLEGMPASPEPPCPSHRIQFLDSPVKRSRMVDTSLPDAEAADGAARPQTPVAALPVRPDSPFVSSKRVVTNGTFLVTRVIEISPTHMVASR